MVKLLGVIVIGSVLFLNFESKAGQSGYLLNGQTVVTHKEGTEVQPPPKDAPSKANKGRTPASLTKISGTLFFEEDDLARCYWRADSGNVFCVKK